MSMGSGAWGMVLRDCEGLGGCSLEMFVQGGASRSRVSYIGTAWWCRTKGDVRQAVPVRLRTHAWKRQRSCGSGLMGHGGGRAAGGGCRELGLVAEVGRELGNHDAGRVLGI